MKEVTILERYQQLLDKYAEMLRPGTYGTEQEIQEVKRELNEVYAELQKFVAEEVQQDEKPKRPGRPRLGERRTIGLTLDPEIWQLLEDDCKQDGLSMSALLREIVTLYVNSEVRTQT